MSAEAEIKQFIDRILRLKEEQDTLGVDIREIYAEAKGRGYDKTAMGNVVAHVRKAEKLGRSELQEREEMFDLYLTAYETGGRAHAPAHTREIIEEFPVDREARRKQRTSESMDDNIALSAEMVADGLISEEAHAENIALSNAVARKYGNGPLEKQIDPKLAHTIVTGMQTETGRKALIAAVDIMIEREEHIDPETGEITTSHGKASDGMDPSHDEIAANMEQGDVDSSAVRASSDVKVVATNSPETATPMDGGAIAAVKSNARLANATGVELPSSNQFTPPAFLAQKSMRDYRPHCQRPDACGASGLKHCYNCSKLAPAESDVA